VAPPNAIALRRSGAADLREHLIAAAARLIARDGTAGLTVRAIAREAGVADGVLYNHFADKEELLADALLAHIRAVEQTLPDPPAPGEGAIDANLRAHLTHQLTLQTEILPAFVGLLAQPKVLARFTTLPPSAKGMDLREALAAHLHAERDLGRLRPDADVDAAATMLVGACKELILPHLFGPTTERLRVPPGFVDAVVRTVLSGVGPV
jgi:AcrR family transcriptional regulator